MHVVDDAGHLVQLDHAALVHDLVRRFLAPVIGWRDTWLWH